MDLLPGKKIYFASDFHFGIPDRERSVARERRVVQWLRKCAEDAQKIYLCGDLFDVWFEWRRVVPKGYTRFLGALAEIADAGISVEAFTGNHDLWMRGYFEDELGVPVHHAPIERKLGGKQFIIGHGDGLGPGDHGYKAIKRVFRAPLSQWLYRRLHPDTAVRIAEGFSRKGPKHTDGEEVFLGADREFLVQFCLNTLKTTPVDFFVFGHRHLPLDYALPGGARYINLGDWIRYDTYAVFGADGMSLERFGSNNSAPGALC